MPKREPSSGQDGQVGAKMALRWPKRPPRWPSWSQHGSKIIPQAAPTWAGIGAQHGLRLRITAPVQQIRGGLQVPSVKGVVGGRQKYILIRSKD